MPWVCALVVWASAAASMGQDTTRHCPVTPLEDRLPSVIAPMAGQDPIWLVDGSFGRWDAEGRPTKSAWVLSKKATGSLVVTGRRLGDGLPVLFEGPPGEPALARLEVSDPAGHSVSPGGASEEILQSYTFLMTGIIYPAPGCWEFNAKLGDRERRIVVEIRGDAQ